MPFDNLISLVFIFVEEIPVLVITVLSEAPLVCSPIVILSAEIVVLLASPKTLMILSSMLICSSSSFWILRGAETLIFCWSLFTSKILPIVVLSKVVSPFTVKFLVVLTSPLKLKPFLNSEVLR